MKRLDPRAAENASPVEVVARLLRVISNASTCPQSADVTIVFKKNVKFHSGTIFSGCRIDSGLSETYDVQEYLESSGRRFCCISGVLDRILHKLPELDWLQKREDLELHLARWAAEFPGRARAISSKESESDDE